MSKCFVDFSDSIILNDKVWFFSNDYNGLFCLNLSNQKIKFMGQVPFEPIYQQQLYSSIIAWENKICLIPFKAKKLAVYDTNTNRIEPVELIDTEKEQFFSGAYIYENFLFLFHFFDATILKVDLRSNEIRVIDGWLDSVEPYLFGQSDFYFTYFRKQLVCRQGKIFIPFCYANAVLEIDCITSAYIIHVIGKEEQGYAGICEDGDNLWLVPKRRNGKVVKWNLETNNKESFSCEDFSKDFAYIGIAKIREQICLFSAVNLQQTFINMPFVIKPHKYRFVHENEECILALNIDKNVLEIYDKVSACTREITIEIDYEETPLIDEFSEKVVNETQTQTLFRLLDATNLVKKCSNEEHQWIGKDIYQKIKK